MLKGHVVLRNFVCKRNDVDDDNVLLPAFFEKKIDACLIKPEELNHVIL